MAAYWTHDENKLFEMSIAVFDHDSPDFFENIRKLVPKKTVQDIQHHYRELERDLQMIESGWYDHALPPMIYLDQNIPIMDQEVEIKEKRTREGLWSDEEHRMFLSGLEKHGRGNWKAIARDFVPGRTSPQVATHAQKYFQKLKKQQMKKQRKQEQEMRYEQQQEIKQQHQQKRMPNQQQQQMQHRQKQQQMNQFQQHEQQQQYCSSSYPQNGYAVASDDAAFVVAVDL